MGKVNALVLERAEANFDAALAAANKWAEVGRPIIMATIRLDGDVEDALRPLLGDNTRTFQEAVAYVRDARKALEEMLDGIRSEFLADQMLPQPRDIGADEEWEARDQFSDALDAEVISVRALIKQVEDEDFAAFLKGGRR